MEGNINSIEINVKNKNIMDLNRDIGEFKTGHQIRTYLATDKNLICSHTSAVFFFVFAVRKNLLYNILTEFVICMNMARLIKMCVN
jgi:hypothetical protein